MEPGIVQVTPPMFELTEGESVVVTVSVAAPAAVDDPFDVELLGPDGSVMARVEKPASPRAYEVEIAWSEIGGLSPISFLEDEERVLVLRASSPDSFEDTRQLPVLLSCGGYGACEGKCREEIDMTKNDTPASYACGSWECGDGTYPQACFLNPTAHLFIAPSDLDRLL
ncbi:MAG: hypothetical protein FJ313_02075, partial [Gemmatimonadetes bacterium]|nr:hypothetical protein [Gemmatimonadota bacterium]